MSTLLISTTAARPNINIQKILNKNKVNNNSQWLPVWLFKWMGYSSFAAAIISMLLYWYKKQSQQRARITTEKNTSLQPNNHHEDDVLHMNPKKKLHVSTHMRRSSSSLYNLSAYQDNNRKSSLATPPPSPLSTRTTSPTHSITSPRSLSPRSWSSRFMDGVISATRKRKRMTISLKNTILWNPSRDVNTPNHAFHENTVLLLNKLAQVYDIYVMIHMNSEEERHQIHQLLNNANLLIDSRKVLYCSSEQGKLHLIKHIHPAVHVEGGWEMDDGRFIMEQLKDIVEQKIWIKSSNAPEEDNNMQCADNILKTSIAKQVGFEC